MRILWLGNVILPKIANKNNIKSNNFGGWLSGALKPFIEKKSNNVCYVFPYDMLINGDIENLNYQSFLRYDADENIENIFVEILNNFKPDVIHIWGTEYKHSLLMVNACKKLNIVDRVVVSIQGIKYLYAKAYHIGLPENILKKQSLRDFIKKTNIISNRKIFEKDGENEKIILRNVNNIIGRTEWDKKSCLDINSKLNYYHCDENLREDFYKAEKWELDKCDRYRIFCSQGNYPIKGMHFAIKALAKLKEKYEDIKLYVTGDDYVNMNYFKLQKKTYYLIYLRKLIKKYKLSNNIVFTGMLNPLQMIEQYRKANVFLSPSTIENSSNSIGEAMLIGTPVVSSNVGGCSTMVTNEKDGLLYELENIDEMVSKIEKIFDDSDLANKLSRNAIKKAELRHSYKKNNEDLVKIYKTIIEKNKD